MTAKANGDYVSASVAPGRGRVGDCSAAYCHIIAVSYDSSTNTRLTTTIYYSKGYNCKVIRGCIQ